MATTHNQEKTAVFALIIGINEYKCPNYDDLKSAVLDAKAIKEYLETSLAVPSENIRFLCDEKATRAAIKQGLHSMITDPLIKKGDTILIYYAGHGATAPAPREWQNGGPKIQLIIPHDCNTKLDGADVQGIPDRTFGALLRKLAAEKGDNITVIFDSCHSGSGTRVTNLEDIAGSSVTVSESTLKFRGIKYNLKVPNDLDKADWAGLGHRALAIPHGFIYTGLASHVHLAACGENESACEDATGGEFTVALLDTLHILEREGKSRISYIDLIRRIGKLSQQQPRCEGKHRDRFFLNCTMPIPEAVRYGVRKEQEEYKLDAGIAQGITKGSKFAIFDKSSWRELGIATASLPEMFSTTIILSTGDYPFDINEGAIAIEIGTGEEKALRLHVAPDAGHSFQKLMQEVCDGLVEDNGRSWNVVISERGPADLEVKGERGPADLDLEVKVEKGIIVFDTLFEPATRYGVQRLQVTVRPKVHEVKPVVLAAAHYYWHLRRVLAVRNASLDCVEFKSLEEVTQQNRGDDVEVLLPHGDNLIKDGVVEVMLEGEMQYGMSIKNKTNEPVYMWVFFFDHGDFTITPLYRPPIASTTDVPIAPSDSLTIGYGDGGIEPISFELDDEYEMDLGFVVVVISNEPIDLSGMEQLQPKRTLGGRQKQKVRATAAYWHTHVIPIIQRKSTAEQSYIEQQ